MRCKKEWLRLYAITDRTWLDGQELHEHVEEALRGGVTMLQLREKHADDETFLAEARTLLPICRSYGVPLLINDRVDIAALSGADGVHIGQNDMDIREARRILGDERIIGTSAHSVEEALAAQAAGADYLGAGSVFTTATKADATHLPRAVLEAICQSVSIPVVAIGGITASNLTALSGSGVDGVALVSAIFAQPDRMQAAHSLRMLADKL